MIGKQIHSCIPLPNFSQGVSEEQLPALLSSGRKVPRRGTQQRPSKPGTQGCPSAEASSENDGSQLLALSPRQPEAAWVTRLELSPTLLGWNQQAARPQQCAGLQGLQESDLLPGCPHSGSRGSPGVRFTRRRLDLITRKSVPHRDPSPLPALGCRNARPADFSATPSFLADTESEPTFHPACAARELQCD